jgi:hypothetical protein
MLRFLLYRLRLAKPASSISLKLPPLLPVVQAAKPARQLGGAGSSHGADTSGGHAAASLGLEVTQSRLEWWLQRIEDAMVNSYRMQYWEICQRHRLCHRGNIYDK